MTRQTAFTTHPTIPPPRSTPTRKTCTSSRCWHPLRWLPKAHTTCYLRIQRLPRAAPISWHQNWRWSCRNWTSTSCSWPSWPRTADDGCCVRWPTSNSTSSRSLTSSQRNPGKEKYFHCQIIKKKLYIPNFIGLIEKIQINSKILRHFWKDFFWTYFCAK